MGRKGGGGRGFLKANRRGAAAADSAQWDDCVPSDDDTKDGTPEVNRDEPQASDGMCQGGGDELSKAVAELEIEPAAGMAGDSSSDDDGDGSESRGTRGHMLQQHKKVSPEGSAENMNLR